MISSPAAFLAQGFFILMVAEALAALRIHGDESAELFLTTDLGEDFAKRFSSFFLAAGGLGIAGALFITVDYLSAGRLVEG